MSYETDRLQQEINSLKWQKAENYKLENLETTVRHLTERLAQTVNNSSYAEERILKLEQELKDLIITLQNEKSYLQERIQTLEDRLNNREV